MAPITTTSAKKTKGMKDHKKALKKKAIAKRAAAAELAKTKKSPTFVHKPKATDRVDVDVSTSGEDIDPPPNEGTAKDDAVNDIVRECNTVEYRDQVIGMPDPVAVHDGVEDRYSTNYGIRENDFDEPAFGFAAPPDVEHRPLFLGAEVVGQPSVNLMETNYPSTAHPQPLQQYDTGSDLDAYNKALDAELYDKMELPQERLLRLSAIKSWDAEAVHDIVRIADSYECDSCDSVDDARSTGFPPETTIARNQSNTYLPAEHALDVLADSTLDISQEMPADTPAAQLSSVEQLFIAAACPGTPIICLPVVPGNVTIVGLPRAADSTFDESTLAILPQESGSKCVSGVRTMACVEAGIAFGQCQPISESFVDPAIISFAVKKQDTAEARPFQASSVPQQHPPLFTQFEDGTQKLKAMLGVTGPALPTVDDPTLQAGAEMLKSMLGKVGRVSSPSHYTGPQTPFTQYSTSPPPLPDQCVDGAVDYGNSICPPWSQFTADGYYTDLYSYPPPGLLDAPFVPHYFAGHPDLFPGQLSFFQGLEIIPVQSEFFLGSPTHG
ncbi:hypothetical protein BKA63DRAFT_579934 [Paraphoma chrysanthemicola]|nr:hypothetical protein BKA63DRAFT_579934 [Paraphoma chrysanthemicola]